MSADKYAQFIAEQQHKLSVSGTNAVELTEKKHMSKADIAALKEPKDKFDEKDLEALRNKEHLKKEEVEPIDEKKDSLAAFERRLRGQAGNGPKSEGNWSNTIKKQAAKAEADKKKSVEEEVEPIDELSKKTLGSYAKQAADVAAMKFFMAGEGGVRKDKHFRVALRRLKGVKKATEKLSKEEVELISIEEQAYLEEMVGKGKLADILMHHKDNMNHHREMAKHHSDMYDKSMEVGDSRGAGHHEEEGMHHEMQAQHHQARYDHAAGLKAQMNAKREMKAAQSAMDAARKKISAAKQDKKDW